MSKKILIILICLTSLATGFFVSKNTQASSVNEILAAFRIGYYYYLSEDIFINKEVNGLRHLETDVRNLADETGEPIKELGATFTSDLTATNWKKEELTKMGPPVYVWTFDDVPQEEIYMSGGFRPAPFIEFSNQPVLFTPGFDASRSADQTVFSGPGIQTLTLTITPREKDIEEKSDGIAMCIYTIKPGAANLVDTIITSPTSDEEHVVVSEDRRSLRVDNITMKTGVPWSINITIEVTPKLGVAKVEYMPFVSVLWNPASFVEDTIQKDSCVMEGDIYSKGTTMGSSVSCVVEGLGTWKWEAKENYIWEWISTPGSHYLVAFEHRQERLEAEEVFKAPTFEEIDVPILDVVEKEKPKEEMLKEEEKEIEKTEIPLPKNIFLKIWEMVLNFFGRIFGQEAR